ncbi:cation:proton antiporter [Eggerthellaceae bacterium PR-HUZ602407-17]|nr:Sodium%2C potassium%2C lithium and rubidium/H(+) antiporter [Chlamydia trachomatis]
MQTITLALVLLSAVLISAVIAQIVPKVSSPLVQIALGALVAIIADSRIIIEIEPELFLVLFIAPLLFHEAHEADKTSLWKNKKSMLSYAIGLVLLSAIVIGVAVHALIPSIGLAAALALGAALGPTDAVAVSSLKHDANIPPRQQAILQGESLLNDASGIVCFQFALGVAVGGVFVAQDAILTFLYQFIGGLVLGIVIGLIANFAIQKVRNLGLENTTFHVLFEVLIPFIAFLVGEHMHVSGVINVVACGITMSFAKRNLGPSISRLNIVSSSVWRVAAFALNGIVFVLLGTQLPTALTDGFKGIDAGPLELIAYILIVSIIMHSTRFVWSLLSEWRSDVEKHIKRSTKQRARSAAITTFAGAKGTITLAIMFTIPTWITIDGSLLHFPNRNLLIFIASGVILLSLILATFIVPLLAPRKLPDTIGDSKQKAQNNVAILRNVIENLTAQQNDDNRRATSEVIRRYNDRIKRIVESENLETVSDLHLRIKALQWEQDYVWQRLEAEEISFKDAYALIARYARVINMLERSQHRLPYLTKRLRNALNLARRTLTRIQKMRRQLPSQTPTETQVINRNVHANAIRYAIERMEEEMTISQLPSEAYSRLIVEYQTARAALLETLPSITSFTRREKSIEEVLREALRLELEAIQSAYEDEKLSWQQARDLRQNVALMQIDLNDQL